MGINLRTGAAEGDTFADNQLAVLDYPKATATLLRYNDPFGFPRRRFPRRQGGVEIQQLEGSRYPQSPSGARSVQEGTVVQLKGTKLITVAIWHA